MESKPRRKIVSLDAMPRESGKWGEIARRWGNTALTILLIAAIIFLGIRWRAARAAQNRLAILTDLTTARTYVQVLENEPADQPPDRLAQSRAVAASEAGDAISLVLNTSDDPKCKAQALIDRGDLDWQLANFPPLPGATTQPALQPPMSADQYLDRAAEAYQQVLSGNEYADQSDAIISAHFGLAAIAENRHQWDEARKQLQAVADNAAAPASLKAAARAQLATMPNIEATLYLSPATQPTAALLESAARPPATRPSTRPTAAPIAPSAWKLGLPSPAAKPPVLLPTTRPSAAATQPAMSHPR